MSCITCFKINVAALDENEVFGKVIEQLENKYL